MECSKCIIMYDASKNFRETRARCKKVKPMAEVSSPPPPKDDVLPPIQMKSKNSSKRERSVAKAASHSSQHCPSKKKAKLLVRDNKATESYEKSKASALQVSYPGFCGDRCNAEAGTQKASTGALPTSVGCHPQVPCIPEDHDTVVLCLWKLHDIPNNSYKQIRGLPMKDKERVAEFFLFMSERQQVWVRRKRRDPGPWSASPLFRDHFWCNIYRELDRGTQFFCAHVLHLMEGFSSPAINR